MLIVPDPFLAIIIFLFYESNFLLYYEPATRSISA
jgi:hypothetical protein